MKTKQKYKPKTRLKNKNQQNQKPLIKIWKIFKISWIIIGIFLITWTISWYIATGMIHTFKAILAATFFFAGFYLVLIYLAISVLMILIKSLYNIIKSIKNKK